jgi:two-component system, OmpR family, response regulator
VISPATESPRILVVDDERSMQLAMSLSLRTGGCDVVTASHAAEAERIAAERRVDLVVLDYMLPEVDGLALAEIWRRAGNHVPILLVSAQTDGPVVWRALRLGIIDMIAKPMEPAQLRRRVRAMLARLAPAAGAGEWPLARGLLSLQRRHPEQALVAWKELKLDSRAFALLQAFALQLADRPEAAVALAKVGWPASWHQSGGSDIFVEYCRRTEELLSTLPPSDPPAVKPRRAAAA